MLYVYPDGTENRIGRQFWNATEACCAGPVSDEVDDSAYLAAVIANVRSAYNVDPRRIFVMGHSNGGFMSYRMACDHADVVAAVASIAGATFADPDDCSPSEPVAALQVHGTDDGTIGYEGGENRGGTYPSATETVEMWAAYNGCDLTPDEPAPASRDLVADLEPAAGHRVHHRLRARRGRGAVDPTGRHAHPRLERHLRHPGGGVAPGPSEARPPEPCPQPRTRALMVSYSACEMVPASSRAFA